MLIDEAISIGVEMARWAQEQKCVPHLLDEIDWQEPIRSGDDLVTAIGITWLRLQLDRKRYSPLERALTRRIAAP